MKYAAFLILILLFGCKNNNNNGPKSTYTIKGRVLNGTTGQSYANQSVDVTVQTKTKTPYASADLGTGMTDAEGNFSVSYTQTSIDYGQAYITVSSNFFILDNIAVNKNVDSTFYLSTMGSLKVSINIQSSITPTDTLFMGVPILNASGELQSIEIDTILHAVNGYYKTFRLPPPTETIHYGIGSNDFNYDKTVGKFRNPGGHLVSFTITGDPYVDNATVNF